MSMRYYDFKIELNSESVIVNYFDSIMVGDFVSVSYVDIDRISSAIQNPLPKLSVDSREVDDALSVDRYVKNVKGPLTILEVTLCGGYKHYNIGKLVQNLINLSNAFDDIMQVEIAINCDQNDILEFYMADKSHVLSCKTTLAYQSWEPTKAKSRFAEGTSYIVSDLPLSLEDFSNVSYSVLEEEQNGEVDWPELTPEEYSQLKKKQQRTTHRYLNDPDNHSSRLYQHARARLDTLRLTKRSAQS